MYAYPEWERSSVVADSAYLSLEIDRTGGILLFYFKKPVLKHKNVLGDTRK